MSTELKAVTSSNSAMELLFLFCRQPRCLLPALRDAKCIRISRGGATIILVQCTNTRTQRVGTDVEKLYV